jgi:hypothetical protein
LRQAVDVVLDVCPSVLLDDLVVLLRPAVCVIIFCAIQAVHIELRAWGTGAATTAAATSLLSLLIDSKVLF